ncbi:MAG: M20 family metallopeptidase [Rhodospirillaceae bacterium]|nr:M20 family metallopeptidase [Rhodospirillaceae bacterium]
MSREAVIDRAAAHFDDGGYLEDLGRRVAIPTESQIFEQRRDAMDSYMAEMRQTLEAMGYDCEVMDNPSPKAGPLMVAVRHEGDDLPTVLTYGHGDVTHGQKGEWEEDRDPWSLTIVGDRVYGRGTADNKGQHSINLAALRCCIEERGSLGFNSKVMIETGEESGSPGLRDFAQLHRDKLAADVLIGSDGPRLQPDRPTLFMGTRGSVAFDVVVDLRDTGHHSGNWGGLISSASILLTQALATVTDKRGQIRIPEWRPEASLTNSVRMALADIEVDGGKDGPEIELDWGEESLSPAERVFAWNSFDILAMITGDPERPQNAVPPKARARCQLRTVVGTDVEDIVPALERHFEREGFPQVTVIRADRGIMMPTRLDPAHPLVQWAAASLAETSGKKTAVIPNLGGSLPNDVFTDVIGVPTLWVPHSYASCSQHAPNEHALKTILREGLCMMTGLFWDVGDGKMPKVAGQ